MKSFNGKFLSFLSSFLYFFLSTFTQKTQRNKKKILADEGNQALQEFLLSKNPKQEHSSTLESYLIKPIQRILKYPLLLQQLKNLTDPYAEEHQHLIEALKGMEKVAEHINEMQRIHEEYGAIFDHLFRQHQKSCKQPIDLSPGRSNNDIIYLLYYETHTLYLFIYKLYFSVFIKTSFPSFLLQNLRFHCLFR